jgi:uncharacterized protein
MRRKIFVNLPVRDLPKSIEFFTQLGFEFNPQFTDENATCMVLSDDGYVMLLAEDFYRTFTNKSIVDTATHNEAILAISADSRAEVDSIVEKALAAGGSPSNDRVEDGPMYGWSFQDLDGHQWEVLYMDPAALQ